MTLVNTNCKIPGMDMRLQLHNHRWLMSIQLQMIVLVSAVALCGCGDSPVGHAPGPGDFTEQDVQNFVTPGRPLVEITNRFGRPKLTGTNGQYLIWRFHSGLVETHPTKTIVIAGEPGYVFSDFSLWTSNGSAVKWRVTGWEKIGK